MTLFNMTPANYRSGTIAFYKLLLRSNISSLVEMWLGMPCWIILLFLICLLIKTCVLWRVKSAIFIYFLYKLILLSFKITFWKKIDNFLEFVNSFLCNYLLTHCLNQKNKVIFSLWRQDMHTAFIFSVSFILDEISGSFRNIYNLKISFLLCD